MPEYTFILRVKADEKMGFDSASSVEDLILEEVDFSGLSLQLEEVEPCDVCKAPLFPEAGCRCDDGPDML